MEGSWISSALAGAAVGLVFGLGPLVADGLRLMGLVRYVNMDLVLFHQLYVAGGDDALAFPLTQKLAEKGILLAWKTQRELAALREACSQRGTPLEAGVCETLKGSLETYRDSVAMLSERIGVLVWHTSAEFEGPVPPLAVAALKAVDRDWKEFSRHAAFLQKYLKRYTSILKKKP